VAVKDGEKKYFQVCYLLDKEDTREREFWNLLEIDDNFDKFVISYDELGNFSYQWIKWMNIITFLTSFR
jgi:predicted AAA+ superfamily ATPase